MDKIAVLQRQIGALDGQSATPPEGYVFWALGIKYSATLLVVKHVLGVSWVPVKKVKYPIARTQRSSIESFVAEHQS